ncbi:MAG: double-strand break repair protein AddB [Pseudorhodobacter sp.]
MFTETGPRFFGIAPGADFPATLVSGLIERLRDKPPDAMARVTLILNTARMRQRVQETFLRSGARLLPRIRLISEITALAPMPDLPPLQSPLRRRLELARLIAGLIKADPEIAPRHAIYDLADSLAVLIDEMHGEGITPDRIAKLDVADHADHWARIRQFMEIVTPLFDPATAPDAEGRQRIAALNLIRTWQETPPETPMIFAGFTGSRGTSALLLQAAAHLPQGAVIVPGYDFDLPEPVWEGLDDALTAQDHPQYRLRRLMRLIGLSPSQVHGWHSATPNPDTDRNRLISLSLRPAPVTDQWLIEGKGLPDLIPATSRISLIEAPGQRAEAMAIALRMRQAAEGQETVALITPDRGLTRQVTAALDRWGIRPDDSAGRPLAQTASGRMLRHIVEFAGQPLRSRDLVILLKHPLTATGADRGPHLRFSRELELHLRRHGPAYPTAENLHDWAAKRNDAETAIPWAEWAGRFIAALTSATGADLTELVAWHHGMADGLAAGPGGETGGALWSTHGGEKSLEVMEVLAREAPHGGILHLAEYRDLFNSVIAGEQVRETVEAHPRLFILGTLEARAQSADLVILGGLNDGIWPSLAAPDPWMNRQMRKEVGLLLPERTIGLAAHDYQQAIAAPEVMLTRAKRDAEAEAVPSRWLNRLCNLLQGLPDRNGPEALKAMRDRGKEWLALAAAMEDPGHEPSAPRPAPRPPVTARPRELPVTSIEKLIRDPYAVYARHILKLYPLNSLQPEPDPRLRGSVLHKVLEHFVRDREPDQATESARAALMKATDAVLATEVPWPAARIIWRARLERAADFFLEMDRKYGGTPVILEDRGHSSLIDPPFTLTARPDRIDRLPDGRVHLFDYKTGSPPTQKQQKEYDKQLLLEAAMAARGGFQKIGTSEVAGISYIGLGAKPKEETTWLDPEALNQIWADLHKLIGEYLSPRKGYLSRRAVAEERFAGDYDHLARYGEWDLSDNPGPEDVG